MRQSRKGIRCRWKERMILHAQQGQLCRLADRHVVVRPVCQGVCLCAATSLVAGWLPMKSLCPPVCRDNCKDQDSHQGQHGQKGHPG